MMSWLRPSFLPDIFKKRVCRYLLNRYLGQFLEEKLTLEQLNINLSNGTGTINDVTLYCQALNDLCEAQEWGIEVIGGRIGSVTVTIPWNALMTDDSFLEVNELFITIRPHVRPKEDNTSMLESVWSSMSSSMQLAQECLENDEGGLASAQSNVMEGLERFAQTIDNVLNRVKARFTNTEIRLEYLPPESDRGIAIIIKIDNIEYQNEAGNDPAEKENVNNDDENNQNNNKQKSFLISTYATHHILMEGITFYTEEYRVHNLTNNKKDEKTPVNEKSMMADQFFSNISMQSDNEQFYSTTTIKNDTAESDATAGDTDDDTESGGDEDDEKIYRTEPIAIGKLTNRQEIRIRMKQADNIPGPKVQLEISLGSFSLLLSPRQLHMLVHLTDVLLKEDDNVSQHESNRQNDAARHREQYLNQSPMDVDIRREAAGKSNAMSGGLGLYQGWSSDDTYNETFDSLPFIHPPSSSIGGLSDSVISTSSSMTSSIGSSAASQSTNQSSRKSRRRQIDLESNADISDFNIRVACFSIILLHEDILMECSSPLAESPLSDQSVKQLKLISDNYFNKIGILNVGLGANDLGNTMKLIDEACGKHHHLRLLLSPIILDGEEQRNSNGIQLQFKISIGRFDFREVLKEITVPLLYFPKDKTNQQIRPDIIVNFNQLQRTIRSLAGVKFAPPKTDVNVSLAACLIEFDISIIDRISGIVNPSPFVSSATAMNTTPTNNSSTGKRKAPKFDVNIESSSVDFKLRFPIADLRPIHDPERIPWWERNIRQDYLLLNLQLFKISCRSSERYEIISNEINIYYIENESNIPIHIGKAKFSESPVTRFTPAKLDYPKIIIEFPSDEVLLKNGALNNRQSDGDDSGPNSGESIGIGASNKNESSPFTSKRICRESDTPHNKGNTDDPETLLIPGDKIEMQKFCDSAMKSSKIQIKIDLPIVSVQIKSKHLYEVIYNRVNSDLLMWEPSAPNHTQTNQQSVTTATKPMMATSLLNAGMMESIYMPFAMCTSKINYDTSSSASNSESESDNDIYYSTLDKKTKRPIVQNVNKKDGGFSCVAFQLNLGQGMVTMYAPVRDSLNHVIPGQLGEFVIKIKNTYLFSVSGFNGNDNLAYFCLQAESAELYHCGLVPVPAPNPPLRVIGCILPTHMQSTFYPTPRDLVQNETKGSTDRDMISLAIQIKGNPEQKRKRIRLAAGIQCGTLRHHFAQVQHTWLTQLTDMFDVLDYTVYGYTPYCVVTELHLHLWDCAIDYRPLYFGYRAVATIGTLMVTSNIASASAGCTLRFVAEECTLSLAPQKVSSKIKQRIIENKISSLPFSDLVCIVDLGLFEISLRLNDKATTIFPKLDLRTSINDIHIRTCSDSGFALAQFISYLAAEGDFDELDDQSSTSDSMSVASEGEADLLSVKSTPSVPEVTPVQQQRVNTLMADAMEESMRIVTTAITTTTSTTTTTPTTEGIEIFFFPDETNTNMLQRKLPLKHDNIHLDSDLTSSIESLDECKKSKLKHRAPSSEFDDDSFDNMFGREASGDNISVNTEMRELLDFETSMIGGMKTSMTSESDALEALPQVTRDLGDITRIPSQPKQLKSQRKISSDTDEDFCFIAEEEKVNYSSRMQEVPMSEEPIRIVDNHFSVSYGKPDLLMAPQDFPMAVIRYTLCEMSLVWHMYGGHDFLTDEEKQKKSANTDRQAPRFHNLPMSQAYKMGVSFSKGSPKVQIGGGFEKLTWKTRGGDQRKHDTLMEIHINKVRFSHETYPTYTEQASRQVLLITELEIRDRLEVSNINKFLYHPAVGPKSKHGSHHMVVLKALHLRPDPSLTRQECCLRLSLLPLRLNIDQDSLEFLVTFFTELGGPVTNNEPEIKSSNKTQSTPTHQPPVMMVEIPEAAQELQARKMVSENLILLMEEEQKEADHHETTSEINDTSPIFFRNIIFGPSVPIRLDYHGKRVEFNRGPLPGLIMGLAQLQCSEIKLKAISHRHGILGVDRLLNFMLQEWLQDIKRNQLPSILSGIGPMHSLVQLFQGIRDLFWLPIEQYQKDGRIVRGLQLGAQSFTARTALAALEITTRLIHLLQITAETAYDMVSPGPSVRRGRGNRKGRRKRFNPPQDIREGVTTAYHIVRDGIGETAHQIVDVAALEHDQKGYTGAVGAVVRQIPPTLVRPLVLVTQATSKVLGGVRNQLVPDARLEAREKWKDDEDE